MTKQGADHFAQKLHKVQIKYDRKFTVRSNVTNHQAHRQTGTVARESSLPQGEENGKFMYEIYTQNKDKFDTDKKIIQR